MADRERAERGSRSERGPAPAPAPAEPDTLSALARRQSDSPLRSQAPDPQKGTRVRAKELGIYNGARRRKGATFVIAAGEKPAKWMEVIGEAT